MHAIDDARNKQQTLIAIAFYAFAAIATALVGVFFFYFFFSHFVLLYFLSVNVFVKRFYAAHTHTRARVRSTGCMNLSFILFLFSIFYCFFSLLLIIRIIVDYY